MSPIWKEKKTSCLPGHTECFAEFPGLIMTFLFSGHHLTTAQALPTSVARTPLSFILGSHKQRDKRGSGKQQQLLKTPLSALCHKEPNEHSIKRSIPCSGRSTVDQRSSCKICVLCNVPRANLAWKYGVCGWGQFCFKLHFYNCDGYENLAY